MTSIFALIGSPLLILFLLFVLAPVIIVVRVVNSNKSTGAFVAQPAKPNVHAVFNWTTSTFFKQIATFRASIPANATASQVFSGYATHFSQYLDALRSSVDANACPPEYRDNYAAYLGFVAQSLNRLRDEAVVNVDFPASAALATVESSVAQLQNYANNLHAIARRYSL